MLAVALGALLLFAAGAFAGPLDNAWLCGTTDKDAVSYKVGEEMVITLTPSNVSGAIPAGEYFLDWKRTDDLGGMETGCVAFTGAPFVYRAKLDKPGFVRLEAYVVGRDGKRYQKKFTGDATTPEGQIARNQFERARKDVFFDGGAGAGIEDLRMYPEPRDFDAFWAKQYERLDKVPIRADTIEMPCKNEKVRLYAVRVDCAGLRPVTGYLSVPKDVDEGKRYSAILKTHGYSGDRCVHGSPEVSKGHEIVFDINAHGLKLPEFGATEADTKALRWEIRSHDWEYARDPMQNEDPETAYFNGMVLRVKRALQYLKTVNGWNGKDLHAFGGSQGGLQTIWAGGCGEGVTRIEAGIVWGCDLKTDELRLSKKIAGDNWYFTWAKGLAYYDAVFFARRIPPTCRSIIYRSGLGDYTCPPMGQAKLYNNIRRNKCIHWMQGSQHGYVPSAYAGRDILRDSKAEDARADEIAKLVAEDVARPVRPYGVDGQNAFWNANAISFMYPPILEFPTAKGRTNDLVTVAGANGYKAEFREAGAAVSLVPIWKDVPVGEVSVTCRGKTTKFWRQQPFFLGVVPPKPRSYAEAARMGYEYLLKGNWVQSYIKTGKPGNYHYNSYPSKMNQAMIRTMLVCAKTMPERRDEALRAAKAMADYLMSLSMPAGTPLEYFPPTYIGENGAAKNNKGLNCLMHPAEVGSAFVKLAEATGEAKYLDRAEKIAATYLKLQGEDGTWYFKMKESDGSPAVPNRLMPFRVIAFLEDLYEATKSSKYHAAAEKALAYVMNGPVKDWNWEGQFEDVGPARKKYENLSKHPACDLAILLLKRWPDDPKCVALARELVRFSEDQFVCWDRPYKQEKRPVWGKAWVEWPVPCAVWEQYVYRVPVDASATKMTQAYLALWRVTKNPLDLEKARTLADANVCVQDAEGSTAGRIVTIWNRPKDAATWLNCIAATLATIGDMAEVDKVTK